MYLGGLHYQPAVWSVSFAVVPCWDNSIVITFPQQKCDRLAFLSFFFRSLHEYVSTKLNSFSFLKVYNQWNSKPLDLSAVCISGNSLLGKGALCIASSYTFLRSPLCSYFQGLLL